MSTTGKPVFREVWAQTQDEIVERMKSLEAPGKDASVKEWSSKWLSTLSPKRTKSSTIADYTHSVNRFIVPEFGSYKLRDLTAGDIEGAMTRWGENLSQGTVRKLIAHFNILINAARRNHIIQENPVQLAHNKPKAERRAVNILTGHDLASIITAASSKPEAAPIVLLAAIGCRAGEAIALDVGDFNPKAGTVAIKATYSKLHGLRSPKTKHGTRTVRVPAAALPALRAAAGARTAGPLFLGEDGGRVQYWAIRKVWHSLLRQLKLDRRVLHETRHSVATALISSGCPIGDAAKFLGDAPATVISWYLHASGSDPADMLDRLHSGGGKTKYNCLESGRKVGKGSSKRTK